MAPQKDNRVKFSAFLHAGHKVSVVGNLIGVSRTTVYSIKKRMDDGEGVNRRAGSCRKTVMIHKTITLIQYILGAVGLRSIT